MIGVYIKGMKMPERCFDCDLCYDMYLCRPLGVDYYETDGFDPSDERLPNCPLIPVPSRVRLLKVLKTERECVSRDCNRDCSHCDLSLEQSEILTVYDTLVSMFSDLADKEGEG